jgi:hypothetical protein
VSIAITVLKAKRGKAVKERRRLAHGKETKFDPTLNESHWLMWLMEIESDTRSDCASPALSRYAAGPRYGAWSPGGRH